MRSARSVLLGGIAALPRPCSFRLGKTREPTKWNSRRAGERVLRFICFALFSLPPVHGSIGNDWQFSFTIFVPIDAQGSAPSAACHALHRYLQPCFFWSRCTYASPAYRYGVGHVGVLSSPSHTGLLGFSSPLVVPNPSCEGMRNTHPRSCLYKTKYPRTIPLFLIHQKSK